jgi:hypothetical protein
VINDPFARRDVMFRTHRHGPSNDSLRSLQASESTSESLSRDISKAVMELQFQDRVNQQIEHLAETQNAVYDRAVPITQQVLSRNVGARLEDWRKWMRSRSTMESERTVPHSCSGPSATQADGFASVEVF